MKQPSSFRRGDIDQVVPGSLWSRRHHLVIVLARYQANINTNTKFLMLNAHHGIHVVYDEKNVLWNYMYVMGAQ
jgi:hypothetical protein